DTIVGTVILAGHYADAGNPLKPIVRHRVVLDADLDGVPICSTKPTHDVNALGYISRDRVAGDGRVGDEVAIAQNERQDPCIAILSDLVVGDSGVGDVGVRPGARQVGHDEDAEAAVTQAVPQHQV